MRKNKFTTITGLALLALVPTNINCNSPQLQNKPRIESKPTIENYSEEKELIELGNTLGKQWENVPYEKKKDFKKKYSKEELRLIISIYKSGKEYSNSLSSYSQDRINQTKSLNEDITNKFPWINPKNPSYEDKVLVIFSEEMETLESIGGFGQLR